MLKDYPQLFLYFKMVRLCLLFSFGTFDSFLAGLGSNWVHVVFPIRPVNRFQPVWQKQETGTKILLNLMNMQCLKPTFAHVVFTHKVYILLLNFEKKSPTKLVLTNFKKTWIFLFISHRKGLFFELWENEKVRRNREKQKQCLKV